MVRARRGGETVARKIGSNDGEPGGESRRELVPRVRGRADPVHEQERGPASHDLDVPSLAARLDESARMTIGPLGSHLDPGRRVAHGSNVVSAIVAVRGVYSPP